MSQLYYQLTGYQAHIRWFLYDDKKLAESIAGDSSFLRSQRNPQSPVELVLGIKHHGTSHLLITKEEAEQIALSLREKHPHGTPLSVSDFESLSPIYFYDVEDLGKKISSLKPKGGAKHRPGDTSQANRGYDKARDDTYRGAFEHGRLLYRILNNSINPQKYSISDASWSKNLRVRSFVFNTKGIDDRITADKIRNPIVLDVGFCDASVPSLHPHTPTHILDAGNALLGGKGKRKAFSYGNSDKMAADELAVRVREVFKDHLNPIEAPMILLVYHEEETMNYIRNIGVDISAWRSGLRSLLFSERPIQNQRRDRSPPRRYNDPSYPVDNRQSPNSRRRPSSRSRSPRRNSMSYSSPSGPYTHSSSRMSSTAYPSSTSRQTYAPVYVVDVRQLYMRLMKANSERLVEIISAFGLANGHEWCAGNEAALIIDIWRSMVSGVSIDEQGAQREVGAKQETKVEGEAGPSALGGGGGGGDDSDDEPDPNDIIIRDPVPSAPKTGGAYSNLDESDYESQSDDSD